MLRKDPIEFLKITDDRERMIYSAVARAAMELQRQLDHERAEMLGKTLGMIS